MSLSTQPYKGARDFYPEDKRLQNYMFSTISRTVQKFGYEEYNAPMLEPLELYAAKSGTEIVNEQTYAFEDRGGRMVAVRPEMTPSVSRMVAGKRQELAYPLRWYSIPNLWRYERPQRGRLREHWQLNVDIFGIADSKAEIELIQVADGILKAFGATHDMYRVQVNSRQLMDFIFNDYLQLTEVQAYAAAKLVDRMNKMDQANFEDGLAESFGELGGERTKTQKLAQLLTAKNIKDLPEEVRVQPVAQDIEQLIETLKDQHITNAEFDITIMRGFDYYTGIVFEISDNHPDNNRAMMGGGRYDGLVGLFGVEPVPTAGFGWGDVTLQNFLEAHELMPTLRTETDMYVVLIGDVYSRAQRVIEELRESGLNVAVDLSGRKPDKQIKAADKKGIRYAIFIGENELQDQQFTLKNLQTGEEERHSVARIASIVEDYRRGDQSLYLLQQLAMQTTYKKLSDTKAKLTLVADQKQLDTAKAATLKAAAKGLKLPGFRQGKVPVNLVEKHANPAELQSDFLDTALNILYGSALDEKKLRPVAQPKVELKKFVPFTELEVELEVEVLGEIKLADYKELRIPRKQITVSSKEVDAVIDQLRQRDAKKQDVDRAAKDGDQVVIDFSGVDNKTKAAIPGTDGKDYPLGIGSNTFIPGFEPELIGLKTGDEKTFTVTFPKDYSSKDLQGKKVDFTVKINKVQALELPELNDEFAAKVGPFKSVDELKQDVRAQMQQEKDNQLTREYADEVLLKVTAQSKMAIPESLIEEQIDRIISDQRQQVVYKGQTWEEFLESIKKTEEEYRKDTRAEAETRVKAGFVLTEISELEDLTVTPQELSMRVQMLKGQYADNQMHQELDKPENQRDIAARMLSEKTADLLVSYASKK